jgi:hypothetical protein
MTVNGSLAATLNLNSAYSNFTVTTLQIQNLYVLPSTVEGSSATVVTGQVILHGPTPLGGAVFPLTSSNPAVASVPASVTIPYGSSSAVFTVGQKTVTTAASVTISATYSGSSATAPLTVTP